ncbi:hypothetical protein [Tunturiibacter gelidoferens]|uniref:Uncharacterized protein n=1 Tax=Tunturiibacter gelidiferens TaxID=3069689 RepID=A0ACC5P109_9BACT|nr:hypothetical protein [Edaphobacter lichenicola]MBB5340507.1 hypothetical protein [Edaphobacter lichenicola]
MNMLSIRTTLRTAALCGALVALASGCNKKADNTLNFTSAINSYYSAHPACLWSDPIKFPVQADTSNNSKTSNYDALVDQGLLVRSTAEKKVLIIASKQVNNYDLSDKGRAAWTADTTQPGYGNFCYGHRKVSSIDSSTPTTSDPGATTQVTYHYNIPDAPAWATAAETQNAYPQLQTELAAPQNAQATLTNTSNGWQVSSAKSTNSSSNDGKIVE